MREIPWWEEKEDEHPTEFLNLTDLSNDEFLTKIGGAQPPKSPNEPDDRRDPDVWDTETLGG